MILLTSIAGRDLLAMVIGDKACYPRYLDRELEDFVTANPSDSSILLSRAHGLVGHSDTR